MNWHTVDLSELIEKIESGGRPHGGASTDSGEIPSLGGENIRLSGGLELEKIKKVPLSFFERMTKGLLQNEDVLINKDGANTGKVGFYENQFPRASINEHVFLMRGQVDHVKQQYLYYLLLSQYCQGIIHSKISGSAQPGLKSDFIKKFPVSIPTSKSEQLKIAEVLFTIDCDIEQTKALINKYKHIKKGFLQYLLNNGIDERGQLRHFSTHKYTKSNHRLIPEDWEVTTLGSFLNHNGGFIQTGPFGSQLHADEYVSMGIPTIMPKDISNGQILPNEIAFITESKANSLSKHRVQQNDIIFARRGDLTRVAPISENEEGWLCGTGCFLLRPPKERLNPTWLSIVYQSHDIQRQIIANAIGSTMLNLNEKIMKDLVIAFPKYQEQLVIVNRLEIITAYINHNVKYMDLLIKLKQGLMQDLICGNVSIEPLMTNVKG